MDTLSTRCRQNIKMSRGLETRKRLVCSKTNMQATLGRKEVVQKHGNECSKIRWGKDKSKNCCQGPLFNEDLR